MQRPQRRVTAPRPLGFTTWRAVAGLPKCFEGKGQNEVISDGQRAPARTARTTQGGFRVWGCELGTPTVYVIKDPTLVDEVRPQESCEKVMVADVEIKITLQEEVLHCSVEQSCMVLSHQMPVCGLKSNFTLKMSFVEVLHSGRRVPLHMFFQNSIVFSHVSISFFFSTQFLVCGLFVNANVSLKTLLVLV